MQSGQACNSLPKMLSDEQLCMILLLHNLTTLLQWWDHGAPATGLFLIWPNGVHQWATIIMCYSWTLSFSVYSRFLHRVVFCTDLFSVIKVESMDFAGKFRYCECLSVLQISCILGIKDIISSSIAFTYILANPRPYFCCHQRSDGYYIRIAPTYLFWHCYFAW